MKGWRPGVATRSPRRRRLRAALLAAIAVAVLTNTAPAQAHVLATTGYSTMTSSRAGHIEYTTSLDYALLVRAARLGRAAAGATGNAARAAALDEHAGAVGAYLTDRIEISIDGVSCEGRLLDTEVESRDAVTFARAALRYTCAGAASGKHLLRYSVFSAVDAVADEHTNLVEYDIDGQRGQAVLDTGHTVLSVGDTGILSSLAPLVRLGVGHIWSGVDHLLFLVVLVLGAGSLGHVLKAASAFTVAHSVTLALAAIGWVAVPPSVVEPLIALSIAFVAIENLLGGAGRHRLGVIFAFGLLHGLGFAGALRIAGDLTWSLASSLVSFNAGIEIGQAVVLASLYGALRALRALRVAPIAQTATGGGVAVIGLVWFLQRVSL